MATGSILVHKTFHHHEIYQHHYIAYRADPIKYNPRLVLHKNSSLPGIEPLPESVGVEGVAVGARLDREGQPWVGVGRRHGLVIHVDHFPVRQNFPVPAEWQRPGDPFLTAGSGVGPLGGAGVVVRVVDIALWKGVFSI